MKISKTYNGFTLVELLTNIVIVSSLSFAMMFVFYEIQQDFDIEENRSEIINYSNRVLDDISNELSGAYQTQTRKISNTTSLQLAYRNTNDITRIWVNSNFGFYKNDTPMDTYLPKDDNNRIKYEIVNFDIDEPAFQVGDIWSFEANNARYASYEMLLEVDLFDKFNNKIETLQFNRIVFSPSKFIYGITS